MCLELEISAESVSCERNPDLVALENAIIEKYGHEEFEKSMERAKFKSELARTIRQRRLDLNMDQKEVAKRLHTTQQQLSRYEVADFSPSIERLFDLCKVLNLKLEIKTADTNELLIQV